MMIVVGGKKNEPEDGQIIKWWLYILYIFMMNILNLKLLISIMGQTWARS